MKILHLSHTDINNDSRILKEIDALRAEGFSVDGLGVEERDAGEGQVIASQFPTLSLGSRNLFFLPKRIRHFFTLFELMFKMLRFAKGKNYSVIHCHDTMILPVGLVLRLFKEVCLVYDAHELESDRNGVGWFLGFLILMIERVSWNSIDHLVVVSDSIGKWYCENLSEKAYTVVLNAPVYEAFDRREKGNFLRAKFQIPENEKIFVYVGILGPGRGVELLCETFALPLVSSHLVFVGFGDYEDRVLEVAMEEENIHFHPRVKHEEVVPLLSSADFGLCLIENVSLSDFYCLPNKLFEYLFAGLPVVACDFPEIAALLDSLDCGRTVGYDKQSLEALIRELATESQVLSVDADALAPLSWQSQASKLAAMYKTIK